MDDSLTDYLHDYALNVAERTVPGERPASQPTNRSRRPHRKIFNWILTGLYIFIWKIDKKSLFNFQLLTRCLERIHLRARRRPPVSATSERARSGNDRRTVTGHQLLVIRPQGEARRCPQRAAASRTCFNYHLIFKYRSPINRKIIMLVYIFNILILPHENLINKFIILNQI